MSLRTMVLVDATIFPTNLMAYFLSINLLHHTQFQSNELYQGEGIKGGYILSQNKLRSIEIVTQDV